MRWKDEPFDDRQIQVFFSILVSFSNNADNDYDDVVDDDDDNDIVDDDDDNAHHYTILRGRRLFSQSATTVLDLIRK